MRWAALTTGTDKAPNLSEFEGKRMEIRDTTVGISGFWYWGAYHDRYGLGTEMNPDSGLSPLIGIPRFKRRCNRFGLDYRHAGRP